MKAYGIIYKIRNKINNKLYFGQTCQKGGFDRRYKHNILGYTHNEHLKRSMEKYGLDNFEIDKEFDVAYSKEELDSLERMYILLYDTTNSKFGYNKETGGLSNGKSNEETKLKIGKSSKEKWKNEEYRNHMTNVMKEKWSDEDWKSEMMSKMHTEENRKKQAILCSERFKGVPKSEEMKIKNSISTKKSWTDERKAKASEITKKMWENEEFRELKSNSTKSQWKDECTRNKMIEGMKKEYVIVDIKTKEYEVFKGRKEIGYRIQMSEPYVQKCMYNGLMHNCRYLFKQMEKFDDKDKYVCVEHMDIKIDIPYVMVDINTNEIIETFYGKEEIMTYTNLGIRSVNNLILNGKSKKIYKKKYAFYKQKDYEDKKTA